MTENSRKRLFKLVLVIVAIGVYLSIVFGPSEGERAYKILQKHLTKRYNEEFVINHLGKRSMGSKLWYEAEIYPKSYIGTPREYDYYYREKGFVTDMKGGDSFGLALYKESANEYYRPKLKEIFGENILPIFNFEVYFKETPTYEERLKVHTSGVLDGAIYIFGSVKTEKDIKKYQEGIFEFVQYLKEIGSFERAKIAFIVIDERVLEDDFEDLGIKWQLVEAKGESKTEKEFLAKREKIMNQIKITSTDKSERIEGINRGDLDRGVTKYYGDYALGVLYVVSPKMMESQHNSSERIFKTEVGKIYNKIEDITIEGFINNLKERNNAKHKR